MVFSLRVVTRILVLFLKVGLGIPFTFGDFSVVDLTHELNLDTVYWPGNPALNLTVLNRGLTPGGFWYESNMFSTAEHGGTHFDAPAHFAEKAWRAHQIPAERLVGPGVVVDVTSKAARDPDYQLTRDDLLDWEKHYGQIPPASVLFMLSGWAGKYPHKQLIFNTDNVSDPSTFHFPGFHPDAIDWLTQHRNIIAVGVDTPSTDHGQSKTFEVHQKVAKANIVGLENVNNLNQLPPRGSLVFLGALKLFDGSGGPVRILALLEGSDNKQKGSLFQHGDL